MFVYVLDMNGQPLMPISRCGKVRRLLRDKKAKVVQRCPFTIKLLFEPEASFVKECYLGVDTGSKHIGVAVVSNDRVLYQSQTELRNNIKFKMDRRRAFRRNRRNRKTRYRKPRFLNRRNSIKKDRLPPSVKHKVQAHIDEIAFCKKILPVSDLIVEVSQFDTALMKNPSLINEKVRHWGYQQGFNYGYSSRRESILHRDNYTCQCCGKKNCRLDVHHIIFRSNGGTNDENNLITLCEDCHKKVHKGMIVLNKKPKKMNLKHATHMSIIRSQLFKVYPQATETFGFITSENRHHLGLEKSHYIDACVIASGGLEFEPLDVVYYKRKVSKGDYKLARGSRSEQKLPTGKLFGFRRFDKVKYIGKEYFIKGRTAKSGHADLMDIFGNKIDFSFMPKGHKKPKLQNCRRISARESCLLISQKISSSIV